MGDLMYNHMCDVMKSTLKGDHVEQLALQYNESNLYNIPSQQENAFVYFRKFRKKKQLTSLFLGKLKSTFAYTFNARWSVDLYQRCFTFTRF